MSDIGIANKLRKICLALDGVEETETFGHPTFRVSAKTFCVLDEYKGESAIAVKVGLPVQGVFLKDPRFYKTPYTGQHGWVSLKTKTTLDWREIGDLVKGSYRLMARRSSAADRSVKRRQ
jgi:predicted DNA-binding protein (MmcQ/YjbR family)